MRTVRTVRQHWWAVAVIAVAAALAVVVTAVILLAQDVELPWDDVYVVETEFRSAQAVTPGQGQTVAVAGVAVGRVGDVRLRDGVARVTLRIDRDLLPAVHADARASLRPRTPLQDMTVELDPGTRRSPVLPDGGVVPRERTTSQVQLDEALKALDADTRTYLEQLLDAGGRALDDPAKIRAVLAAGAPTVRRTHDVLDLAARRRVQVRRLTTRLHRVSAALSDHDGAIRSTVEGAATTLRALGDGDADLRRGLAALPGTLERADATARDAARLTDALVPASRALRPALRTTTGALPRVEPLLRELPARVRPVLRVSHDALAPVRDLRAAVGVLRPRLQDLRDTGLTLQHLVNVIGYDAPGPEQSYAYYLAWLAHNANSLFSTQDAHGPAWRGQLLFSCSSFTSLDELRPVVGILDALQVCR
ncbi:MlaD family protein [Patulibacter sp.]|uniref:MlaD family protein n=1 Tax=Patulibacter sp. TaxID=1912859 RepID=UPI002717DD4E|nr:MlaD family protein [Patulibacter sp.]MDO9410010.1 MlaD family protein [Patulibacter sp.]